MSRTRIHIVLVLALVALMVPGVASADSYSYWGVNGAYFWGSTGYPTEYPAHGCTGWTSGQDSSDRVRAQTRWYYSGEGWYSGSWGGWNPTAYCTSRSVFPDDQQGRHRVQVDGVYSNTVVTNN